MLVLQSKKFLPRLASSFSATLVSRRCFWGSRDAASTATAQPTANQQPPVLCKDSAESLVRLLVKDGVGNISFASHILQDYLDSGRMAEVLFLADAMNKHLPVSNHQQVLTQLSTYIQKRNIKQTLQLYDRIISYNLNHIPVRVFEQVAVLACQHSLVARVEDIISDMKVRELTVPDNIYRELAQAYTSLGRIEDALKIMERVSKPSNAKKF